MPERNSSSVSELMKGFERVCRAKGLRITHQRTEIFHELAKFHGHPTAENVFKKVRKKLRTISLDTVYRTILTFENNGLIKRVQILDNVARFDINLKVHHHLICTRCKKIEDFMWPDFDNMELPADARGWPKIHSKHVEVRGLCSSCGAKLNSKK
ncbi:MAG: transcriptional repressor [candidate division Zixibacteria bacterium]|nr:transcriptional repressor [candidate division Zixibacteria bacterium]